MAWPEIEITYRVTLDPDRLEEAKDSGLTAQDVARELRRQGIKSHYVSDCEVQEVGNVSL